MASHRGCTSVPLNRPMLGATAVVTPSPLFTECAGIIVDAVEWVTALSVPSIGGRFCLPSISPPRHCRRAPLLQEAERLLVLVSLPCAVI